jgi:hypothetical protein
MKVLDKRQLIKIYKKYADHSNLIIINFINGF